VDLIFPHHENAIAISYAATGKPLANYWIHNELVMVKGKKPSGRNEDGTVTLRDILAKGYTARDVRYWVLSHHYAKRITFSWSKLDAARNTLAHLDQFAQKLHLCPEGPPNKDMDQVVYDLRHQFVEAMDDDFNVSAALAALFQFVHRINRTMDRKGLSPEDKGAVLKALRRINSVLGVMELEPPQLDKEIEALILERAGARQKKDWPSADRIRDQLKGMGIELIDTKEGTRWRKIREED
jgi:cysteinyl-tRNA synthetase